jgi:regulatory protein
VTDPDPPREELLDAALRLLSARARSIRELRGRLAKKGFGGRDLSNCILWLEARGYLDDAAFARAFIRDRLRFSPRSRALLHRELRQKGVSSGVADEALTATLEEEGLQEEDLARDAARRWVGKQSPSTRKQLLGKRFSPPRERQRKRLYGYLARRGFLGDSARIGMEEGEKEARALEG